MLGLMLGAAAGRVNFDMKHLKPAASSIPAALADVQLERPLKTQVEAVTLAYLWNMGCFLPECSDTIQKALLPLLPRNSPLTLAQELIQAVGNRAPSARIDDEAIKLCFMPIDPGACFVYHLSQRVFL